MEKTERACTARFAFPLRQRSEMANHALVDLPLAREPAEFAHEVVTVRSVSEFRALRQMWLALTRDAEDASLCDSYEYCELAASIAMQQGAAINVVLVRSGTRLDALWPFAIKRRGLLRVAGGLTSGTREEYGRPLVRRGSNDALWGAIAAAVRHVKADVLEVHWVPDGSVLHEHLKAMPQSRVFPLLPTPMRGHQGYFLDLRGLPSVEDFVRELSSPRRYDLRRYQKRLDAKGHTEFGWCTTAEETAQLVTWVFEQKRAWAAARGIKTDYLEDDRATEFFVRLAQRLDLANTPLVSFVKVNGTPAAAVINLVGGDTVEYAICTYDPTFKDCAVGFLMLRYLIEWSYAHGKNFDFRPVYADYKERWSTRQTWHETQLIFLNSRGHLLDLALLCTYSVRAARKLKREAIRALTRRRGRAAHTAGAAAAQPGGTQTHRDRDSVRTDIR
jgi:CelD/BcsL family acetyltransferase involved in cellulose biosynthesis